MSIHSIATTANVGLLRLASNRAGDRHCLLPGICVFHGPAGRGKTLACMQLARDADAYYIQMRSAWSRKTLLEKVLIEMSIQPAGTIPMMLDTITAQLAASRRPLIIDEFDHCLRSEAMLELVRDIYEASQGTLVLVGYDTIKSRLSSPRYEHFSSRVLSWVQALPVSIEDARALAGIYAPDVSVADCLLAHLVAVSAGSARRVCVNLALVQEASTRAGETEMTRERWGKRELYDARSAASRRGEE
ncbi:MAG: ATP-binding protein [Betaproteobacteria bacterium]|nr:ATP-binding protein [Betaproteobacteria bacterium]